MSPSWPHAAPQGGQPRVSTTQELLNAAPKSVTPGAILEAVKTLLRDARAKINSSIAHWKHYRPDEDVPGFEPEALNAINQVIDSLDNRTGDIRVKELSPILEGAEPPDFGKY